MYFNLILTLQISVQEWRGCVCCLNKFLEVQCFLLQYKLNKNIYFILYNRDICKNFQITYCNNVFHRTKLLKLPIQNWNKNVFHSRKKNLFRLRRLQHWGYFSTPWWKTQWSYFRSSGPIVIDHLFRGIYSESSVRPFRLYANLWP